MDTNQTKDVTRRKFITSVIAGLASLSASVAIAKLSSEANINQHNNLTPSDNARGSAKPFVLYL